MWIAAVCAFEDSVVPLDRHNSLKFVNGSRGSWSCKYGFSVWLMCHSMEARAVDKSSESNQYAKEALMSREARADLSTVQVLCILSWIGGVRRPGAADKRGKFGDHGHRGDHRNHEFGHQILERRKGEEALDVSSTAEQRWKSLFGDSGVAYAPPGTGWAAYAGWKRDRFSVFSGN
ncbi:unnamed protein product [Symbiodinium natans]|uniref:Uncharacterized protein n=1 Tax=Symbiodinium natans TaxID=878477 RepID=A0A812R3Z4_9DINO|nr:unnamed protein product [Symbiodinium natans]